MKLTRYRSDPFKMLGTLQDEINKLFEFPGTDLAASDVGVFAPSLDLSEDEKNIYVEADIPGFE
ncbi:MAG: Hsp20/alpha crystallin family protein, partial [Candidatus Omnitrophica bacterium]|nr:Hsp20/alpha crystallin family protein [Candidatus Omnitrophota bacterium]MBD3269674.1 Hsp20/alpha crystallin family protein [Candidatus Omnitrophota bacterium]